MTFYPYQQFLAERMRHTTNRKIHFVRDKPGDSGKTVFLEWMEYARIAQYIPPQDTFKEIMAAVMATPTALSAAFSVDVPRSLSVGKTGNFWAGMEAVKDGKKYDPRYNFKKAWFSRPEIIVTGNYFPVFKHVTKNKWLIFDLTRIVRPDGTEEVIMEQLTPKQAGRREHAQP